MADTHRLRHHGSRASTLLVGVVLGLAVAAPAAGARPVAVAADSESQATEPAPPVDAVRPAATSTSTTSTSTSTSTTTSTTSTTTPPPTTPVTSSLVPPLVESTQAAEIGTALRVTRVQSRPVQRTRATGAVLPFTGSGTLPVIASGLGALAIGALALWWGKRKRPELDVPEPGTTG